MQTFHRRMAAPMLACAIALGTAGFAHAQQQNPAAQQQAAAMQEQIAQTKTLLNITAAQEGAWGQYIQAYTQPAVPGIKLPTDQEYLDMKLPQRITFLKALRADETALINRRMDAALALYNQLNDAQKKTFDELQRPPQPQAQTPAAAAPKPGKKRK